jgi:transcriptional regulator with XRE-family HTH domain
MRYPLIPPREIREQLGLSLTDASKEAGCSVVDMRRFESDASTVSPSIADLLASWYLHVWHRTRISRLCVPSAAR